MTITIYKIKKSEFEQFKKIRSIYSFSVRGNKPQTMEARSAKNIQCLMITVSGTSNVVLELFLLQGICKCKGTTCCKKLVG